MKIRRYWVQVEETIVRRVLVEVPATSTLDSVYQTAQDVITTREQRGELSRAAKAIPGSHDLLEEVDE